MLLGEAVHVVREAKTLADVEEEPGAHAFPEDGVQKVERVAVGMQIAHGARAEADVCLLGLHVTHLHVGTVEHRWRRCRDRTV